MMHKCNQCGYSTEDGILFTLHELAHKVADRNATIEAQKNEINRLRTILKQYIDTADSQSEQIEELTKRLLQSSQTDNKSYGGGHTQKE